MKQRLKSQAERWRDEAMLVMDYKMALIGYRLIEQMELDLKHHDHRLADIMGTSWFEVMLRYGSRKGEKAGRQWKYMIETRSYPPRNI
ncbi:hypothetical protein [Larsenimonas suaedae]|uniref:Uncharacterized protein n=1 Tax=Larsenimonas suaedae TaxID=1851019 RepID=A0ABU1GZ65_9GAMM|nr:hypothetical protein [Larsenimonas suaedae]MCM2973779.1 hypothetical protein [Larsenimonas suaedae]MDR5897303.1 hypothetical protein [Larsenimonas suaedae]